MRRVRPASSCSGLRTGIAAMVVQLGLAMMPRPASMTAAIASGLTSETTSGISGSLRKAEELSTTITPASTNSRAERAGRRRAGGEERDVEPRRVGGLGVLDGDLTVTERQHRAGRAGGGEEADLVGREVALQQDLAHGDADLAGGTDDADVDLHAHRPVPP